MPSLPQGRHHRLILPGESAVCRALNRKRIPGVQKHRPTEQRRWRQQDQLAAEITRGTKANTTSLPTETKATWHHQKPVLPQQEILHTKSHQIALAVLDLTLDQAGLELRNSPASASQVLGLKACTTTAWLPLTNLEKIMYTISNFICQGGTSDF